MNARANLIVSRVCWIAMAIIAIGLIFGPAFCFAQFSGRPASEIYVTSKINAHASMNNAHADIRAELFSVTTNINALTINVTNATESAHIATVQANAAILKNTQQDADISYLYASNANTMAIANLANTRAQAAAVTNAQNGAAITSVLNLTVTAQATANTAYSWGDHAGLYKASDWFPSWTEVTGKPTTFPPETHSHDYTAITNAPWLEEYTETDPIWTGVSNTVTVGAALGATAVQAESDPVAMAALAGYQSAAYCPPNATASSWFTFVTNSGAITITGYNIAGGTDVVIPDYINGWPVTEIGANAFAGSDVTSIGGAGNVVTVGVYAFYYCSSLASVSLPQVQTVGDYAFYYCSSLVSVLLPQVQTVGDYAFNFCSSLVSVLLSQVQTVGDGAFAGCTSLTSLYFDNNAPTIVGNIFVDITPNQVTIYVTNPTATGWGDRLGGVPVVRLPLHGDEIYKDGLPVATEAHVAQAIAAIEFPVASTNYTAWTGTVTPADGTATVTIAHGNHPVLVTAAPCVLTLDPTGYGTAGVSRVSLSYYPGTNSFTFATNVISYAETPTVDTNGWNTLLIRRVSNSDWKGVGL